ncbi:flagellar filament capping protein FliD [Azoarcus sp. DN11]|uniref:flagellar filament capping protein FliD n=1 Tax=Azoarcus sp. DN11 TaxID=356837 RepID=UPI000EB418A8|nr:flagellar filament capping protein FliD [Azoarcus sp. DN11]AYH43110.1 flagellar hook-associated protein [Azoarcus sp. DN11]
MALTANGLGSGLDVNGLVGQLMAVEQRPLTALAAKESSYQAKLSAFGQLKSVLSALQTASDALKDPTKFSAKIATPAADAGFTATAASAAAVGSYAIQVTTLAAAQRSATNSTTTFVPGAGTLSVTIGGQTKTLNFAGGTIEQLRDAINGGNLGITANVIDNGTAKQLVLTGQNTGAANAFTATGLGIETSLYQVQAAKNAALTIDGISISRASNTISDALTGVTLTLTKETTTAARLAVADDPSAASNALGAFVKAYNDANNAIKNLTAFDPNTRRASTLTGDSTARSIQSRLRGLIGGALSGFAGVQRLSDLGIAFQADGTLAIDNTKLTTALKDHSKDVGGFFSGGGSITGFAATLSTMLDGFLGSAGLLAGRTDGINASIKALGKQRDALNVRLEQIEKRYRAQFTALDSMVSSMTQTSSFLTQQIANLPKIG